MFEHVLIARRVRKASAGVWPRLEFVALLGTIPAFYLAMLSQHRAVSVSLYLVASIGSLGSPRRRGLTLALGVALLLCALLPDGDGPTVLALRLGAAALIVLRMGELTRSWFWRGGLPRLLALAIAVFGLCGLGFWWLEPHVHSFGDGLWLAFTTAATVGYGDIVPSTPAAKVFAVFVVLMGFAVLSLVTAAIAAMWVHTEERKIEHEVLHDLGSQLKSIRDELAALRRERG
jgi:voltage-gated potassium channel